MPSFSAPYAEPHRYGLKWIARAGLLFLAVVGIGFSWSSYSVAQSRPGEVMPAMLFGVAIPLLLGLYFGVSAFTYFLQLDSESVSMGGLLRTRTLRLDSVKGRRKIWTRRGSYLVLYGKNPGDPTLRISRWLNTDGAWNVWLQTVPDLDEVGHRAVLSAIVTSEELGSTPQDRLAKLRQAKTIAIVLSIVAAGAALAAVILAHSLSPAAFGLLDMLLILLPWIAIMIQAPSPLLYASLGSRKDPRPTLLFVLLAPGFGLLVSPFANLQSVAPETLFAYACVPGGLLAILLFLNFRKGPGDTVQNPFVPYVLIALIGGLYGFGTVQQANTQLDNSPAQSYTSAILRKTVSHGRSTTYYLTLSPWGPVASPRRISVALSTFNSVRPGDPACITAHEGALHVGWYTVQPCD